MDTKHCAGLYYLSSIACMLAECLDEKQLNLLSADLSALSEMIESILVRKFPEDIENWTMQDWKRSRVRNTQPNAIYLSVAVQIGCCMWPPSPHPASGRPQWTAFLVRHFLGQVVWKSTIIYSMSGFCPTCAPHIHSVISISVKTAVKLESSGLHA